MICEGVKLEQVEGCHCFFLAVPKRQMLVPKVKMKFKIRKEKQQRNGEECLRFGLI